MHKYLGKGVRKQENITDMAIAANTANTDQKRENLLNLSLSVQKKRGCVLKVWKPALTGKNGHGS